MDRTKWKRIVKVTTGTLRKQLQFQGGNGESALDHMSHFLKAAKPMRIPRFTKVKKNGIFFDLLCKGIPQSGIRSFKPQPSLESSHGGIPVSVSYWYIISYAEERYGRLATRNPRELPVGLGMV
ncbi:unnamed protein product [Linum trigynum]|uniref:Uncharacterized protein n=1 Tax=Linum trigynum TaxID=586398 RepID=A0AAV2E5Q2_9ROSI